MRIRKRQHPLLHGAAFLLTGGMSAPVSAAMMGTKAARNRKADEEMERLIGAAGDSQAQRALSTAARLAELRELHDAGHITDEEYETVRLQVIAGI
jgi:putative oligomerization/nucleic acid binding protein